jgi:signal transduction histidine kinase/CheY-like chemotaxis protein
LGLYRSVSPHLATSARERRGQIPVRLFLAVLLAWSLWAAGRAELILPWLAVSAAVQLYEALALAPFRRPDGRDLNRHRFLLPALTAIFAMALIHAGVALLIWSGGGQALSTVAVLILAGGLLNNIASGIESRPLFLLGAAPYLTALAAMPLMRMATWQWTHIPLLTVCVALFFLAVLGVWSRVHAARLAEIRALADAETRLEQAEAAMADRAAMAAIVSHELRTPVSAIVASAQVIRDDRIPERTSEAATLILDAGRLMTGMLNDLLDHSKIEARAMTLETRDFDLVAFMDEAGRFWAAPAAEKGLTLTVRGPGEPLWLKGDPHRLRQIVNNLISNAIKFTPRGDIRLEVETEAAPEGGRRLRLSVRDQGEGIATDAMARLFAPFAQGSTEVARTYGGTGLGLTVSRDLARLMGGDLTAQSVSGEGAVFTLEVVLAEGEPVEDARASDAAPASLGRRLRILAVDDHEVNRRTLALVLQPLDVSLATASDGREALAKLAAEPFDVVLMDVNMPGLDGNETTRRLRAGEGLNRHTPVIGFSAGVEPAQVAACMAAGMIDWLPKPLEPRRLYEALERAVAGRGADSEVAA